MKKSKFLLLGSVASLASIPFVAAKCGETKEEKKPEGPKPELANIKQPETQKSTRRKDKSNKEKMKTAAKKLGQKPTQKTRINLNREAEKQQRKGEVKTKERNTIEQNQERNIKSNGR